MIATIWPGSMARAAGAVTCASTLPTATAMPAGRPVQRRPRGQRRRRGRRARPGRRVGQLVAAKSAKRGSSAARKSADG